jgi:hypothetical protein
LLAAICLFRFVRQISAVISAATAPSLDPRRRARVEPSIMLTNEAGNDLCIGAF